MTELKCCPFCGGKAEVGYANQHDKLFVVGCNTPMCYGNINHFTMVFVSKESAIDAWNTRTPMANIVEKLEELKKPPFIDTPYHTGFVCGVNYSINIVKQEINKEN